MTYWAGKYIIAMLQLLDMELKCYNDTEATAGN